MTIHKRLVLPLAFVGGATLTAALALRLRYKRRQERSSEQTTELSVWEGEGGKPAASHSMAPAH